MSKNTNTNYNHISVKTDSMVKMLEQLSKLGVFKKKRGKPRKSKMVDEIKQDSDMVGYVKPIPGGQFGLRTPLTQNQLEDIQRKNEATIARLSGEVQQQRLADIEAQQGQRFADIERLGGIINPLLERFRSAQEPGAGVYDPFMIPDTQEERFTQTLNEGGPEAVEQPQGEEIYAGEEDLPEGVAFAEVETEVPQGGGSARLEPVGKISREQQPITDFFKTGGATPLQKIKKGKPTRNEFLELNGLGPLPPNTKKTTLQTMLNYYTDFSQVFGLDLDESVMSDKGAIYKDMVNKIDDFINLSI